MSNKWTDDQIELLLDLIKNDGTDLGYENFTDKRKVLHD
jgi:hypothetical protein